MSRDLLAAVGACLLHAVCAACLALPRAEPSALGWDEAVAALREQLPPARSVSVRVCDLPDDLNALGLTLAGPRGALRILVDSDLDASSRLRVLAHEWAHAMVWSGTLDDHDEAWGVAFSRAYRVVMHGWRPR